MKRIIAAALIAAGIAGVAPAIAQHYDYDDPYDVVVADRSFCDNDRAAQLNWQIRREVRQNDIDWGTARDLRDQVVATADLERRYCASGMTNWRAAVLDRQYARIERDLRDELLG